MKNAFIPLLEISKTTIIKLLRLIGYTAIAGIQLIFELIYKDCVAFHDVNKS